MSKQKGTTATTEPRVAEEQDVVPVTPEACPKLRGIISPHPSGLLVESDRVARFTWCLTIATYNRSDCLRRCIELAMAQTRLPHEVVVVDASDDWESNRRMVIREIEERHPGLRCTYVKARVRSLTHQRNQALELASSDVLFMIDDDSFMFPDCAEEIMKIYDADSERKVAGVSASLSTNPPSAEPSASLAGPTRARAAAERLERMLVRRFHAFYAPRLVLPYDGEYPDREIPPTVLALGAVRLRYFLGMCMTYRREVFVKERFSECLIRYAAGEDLDASYRISRHGALVQAPRARLFHAKSPLQRLSRRTIAMLSLTNFAVLYRLYGYDPDALFRRFRSGLRRRALIDMISDLGRRQWTLPRVRGDWRAYWLLDKIQRRNLDELPAWYHQVQVEIIERNLA